MDRQIMWSPWLGPGLEHLRLFSTQEGIVADSVVLGVQDQKPFRVHYEIQCTSRWELRTVHVSVLSDVSQSLHLFTDGAGSWTTQGGEAFPLLEGCLDVDLSITPFTNTLPIRRLALQPGMATTLAMAYIALPHMQIKVTKQRYTCLDLTPSTEHYLFESLKNGVSSFTAELPVDKNGLV
ncbi:MAG: putative glycolipid-binding domain-containing protein, partial [Ktedonobacteraceae bacterium]|nr:putative glycolipid-binding domain-containing protein [Ktedonobacteraceae bacterium]